MRGILSTLLFCMACLTCHAEKKLCVVIHETQGQTAFDLEHRPVVSFTETDVKMVCHDMTVLYPLTESLKITIEEADPKTAIDEVTNGGAFTITKASITAHGCDSMSIYTPDGKTLATGTANATGMVTLPIGELPSGVYVVKANNKVFKIYKK